MATHSSTPPFPPWDIRAYEYDLPSGSIAQHPVRPRDASRLLWYTRATHHIRHRHFRDITDCVRPGDTLVMNSCRVFPARLRARRHDTGTAIELLLTEENSDGTWTAMARPGRSCRPGVQLDVGDATLTVTGLLPDGRRVVSLTHGAESVDALCRAHGEVPLPPYIDRPNGPEADDAAAYQTVYAHDGHAVAAPTAGLHFTPHLLDALVDKGCSWVTLSLQVGPGTFQPVKEQDIRRHIMHTEQYSLPADTATRLNSVREHGGRIIAVGTTALRTLESCCAPDGTFSPGHGATDIFIYPPYTIRSIDALITNFHLPRSTLLMLIAAWVGEAWRDIYSSARDRGYRFYSYGDAMFLE